MSYRIQLPVFLMVILSAFGQGVAQNYTVVPVTDGGRISGTVRWSGPTPNGLELTINKDPEVCDPEHHKVANTDRLILLRDAGVANTVIFIKNIAHGKPMNLPEARQHLDQKHCRYEPHILLVPAKGTLSMKSSDAVLHTVHMIGAASFNVPFPFTERVITKEMDNAGAVSLRCNGGHVWMNAEMMVVPHPYYAVTDDTGSFELNGVPPGTYELVAWHEGWHIVGREDAVDVFSQGPVQRAIFSEPKTWQKSVTVLVGQPTRADFNISEK